MLAAAGACSACGSTLVRSQSPAKGFSRLRCETCGLGRIDPLPGAAALAAYYSNVYALAADVEREEGCSE